MRVAEVGKGEKLTAREAGALSQIDRRDVRDSLTTLLHMPTWATRVGLSTRTWIRAERTVRPRDFMASVLLRDLDLPLLNRRVVSRFYRRRYHFKYTCIVSSTFQILFYRPDDHKVKVNEGLLLSICVYPAFALCGCYVTAREPCPQDEL
jgi:hypothetical protein